MFSYVSDSGREIRVYFGRGEWENRNKNPEFPLQDENDDKIKEAAINKENEQESRDTSNC